MHHHHKCYSNKRGKNYNNNNNKKRLDSQCVAEEDPYQLNLYCEAVLSKYHEWHMTIKSIKGGKKELFVLAKKFWTKKLMSAQSVISVVKVDLSCCYVEPFILKVEPGSLSPTTCQREARWRCP